MAVESMFVPLAVGTPVKIRHSGYKRAWVGDYRGPFGPKGTHIYSVLVNRKMRTYIEVREDQLEVQNDPQSSIPAGA